MKSEEGLPVIEDSQGDADDSPENEPAPVSDSGPLDPLADDFWPRLERKSKKYPKRNPRDTPSASEKGKEPAEPTVCAAWRVRCLCNGYTGDKPEGTVVKHLVVPRGGVHEVVRDDDPVADRSVMPEAGTSFRGARHATVFSRADAFVEIYKELSQKSELCELHSFLRIYERLLP
ncbi:hypothetical protein CLOM_g1561 [Closterium sp. NIES-68]|nr:hypothetical protein CLOM_g9125 [Closterium sp. NIES-68]GJP41947.1 hypothetical protein CLOM_g1561 [Closterium sp. NIES-68]GJP81114.1 hypothetical protein CLOP_g11294 [Closterium sp. NIES-67]GJP85957.1 hypothetical protein CLOP_g16043 [Closterium sp. NIES-67]